MDKKTEYHLGVDYGVEGGDMTSVVIRHKDEIRVIPPEDYVLEKGEIKLMKDPASYFELPAN